MARPMIGPIGLARCGILYPGSDVMWDVEVAHRLPTEPMAHADGLEDPWLIHDGTLHGVPAPCLIASPACARAYHETLLEHRSLGRNAPKPAHDFPSNVHCACSMCLIFLDGSWRRRDELLFPDSEHMLGRLRHPMSSLAACFSQDLSDGRIAILGNLSSGPRR